MVALLGHAYAAANQRTQARVILQQLTALAREKYVPSYPVAAIYAALARKTKRWQPQAKSEPVVPAEILEKAKRSLSNDQLKKT